jgi:uncharacterized protein (TIGR02145 family)
MRPISLQAILVLFICTILWACSKEELTESPTQPPSPAGVVKDVEGNSYETVKVGEQVWFKDNLNTSRFNDGSSIPAVHNAADWFALVSPGWTNYQGSSAYNSIDGKFYNWYAVNSGKLCPKGWHVPTEAEWKALIDHLGGESVAGGKMKQTYLWEAPNRGADNSSGIEARPAGFKEVNGYSDGKGKVSYWWSSTQKFNTASSVLLNYLSASAHRSDESVKRGHCVRCIKD